MTFCLLYAHSNSYTIYLSRMDSGCQCFDHLLVRKKRSESNSNNIVSLFLYCYVCCVDFPILIVLELYS